MLGNSREMCELSAIKGRLLAIRDYLLLVAKSTLSADKKHEVKRNFKKMVQNMLRYLFNRYCLAKGLTLLRSLSDFPKNI